MPYGTICGVEGTKEQNKRDFQRNEVISRKRTAKNVVQQILYCRIIALMLSIHSSKIQT